MGPALTGRDRCQQLIAHCSVGTRRCRLFGGPNAESLGEALSLGFDLADAEIHLAVAPHGALDPALLPASISTPVGDPSFWWLVRPCWEDRRMTPDAWRFRRSVVGQ
jgi:hypothetical protein